MSEKNEKRKITSAVVNIRATFNNTIITIADLSGGVLAWSSSGSHFKGNKNKGEQKSFYEFFESNNKWKYIEYKTYATFGKSFIITV